VALIVDPLGGAGFGRVRKRLTWIRETDELIHIVNVSTRWGKYYMIQWGIRCEPVTTILWGPQRDPHDVAYSPITSRVTVMAAHGTLMTTRPTRLSWP
jgi:hypothetical protein